MFSIESKAETQESPLLGAESAVLGRVILGASFPQKARCLTFFDGEPVPWRCVSVRRR